MHVLYLAELFIAEPLLKVGYGQTKQYDLFVLVRTDAAKSLRVLSQMYLLFVALYQNGINFLSKLRTNITKHVFWCVLNHVAAVMKE